MASTHCISLNVLLTLLAIITLPFFLSVAALGDSECIRHYYELEAAMVNNRLNTDNLTQNFFPPNEPTVPVVDVFYKISNTSSLDSTQDLEYVSAGYLDYAPNSKVTYRFRWSETPIYLFMDPKLLQDLSLFSIRLYYHAVHLVVPPICDNYTVNGVPLPEHLLNQMTSLLKVYTVSRKIVVDEGVGSDVGALQGYASYFNESRFIVIGYTTNYKENLALLTGGLILLSIFITIATPLLISTFYDTLYTLAKREDSNAVFVIWATIIMYTSCAIILLGVDVHFLFVKRLSKGTPSDVWAYVIGIITCVFLLVLAFILTLLVKKKRGIPLPFFFKFLCCHSRRAHYFEKSTVIQSIAIFSAIIFMQLTTFHTIFIFFAFVASPIQTGSTVLLFITAFLSGISLITLFLATFQNRESIIPNSAKISNIREYFMKLLYLILFLSVLAFTILFATCFIRITIYTGDIQSGGIPGLFASLAPSILLGGLGYIGKKFLENYTPEYDGEIIPGEQEDKESDPITVRYQSTDNNSNRMRTVLKINHIKHSTDEESP